MVATRTVALIPTVVMAVAFEATNTFDLAAQVSGRGDRYEKVWMRLG